MHKKIYSGISGRLHERIGCGDFFNGSVSVDADGESVTFKCTLIIYHDAQSGEISDIIPVWWEFIVKEGAGLTVDEFSWGELKDYLLCRKN